MTNEFNPQSPENPALTGLRSLTDLKLPAFIEINKTIEDGEK
jgi:hypothetical protein